MIRFFSFLFIGLTITQATSVSILRFKTKNIKNERPVKALYSEIEKELKSLEYEVRTKNDISSLLEKEGIQLNRCDFNCLADLGLLIGSDLLVVGDLSKTGTSYTLILEFFNVDKRIVQKTIKIKSNKGSLKLIAKLKQKLGSELLDKSFLEIESGPSSNPIYESEVSEIATGYGSSSPKKNNSFLKVITDDEGNLKSDKKKNEVLKKEGNVYSLDKSNTDKVLENNFEIVNNELIQKTNDPVHSHDEESSFSKLKKHFGFAGREDTQKPILTFDYDLPAHPIRYEVVDKHSKTINHNENEPIHILADRITENSNNEYEKIRAIYIWITKNISYDMESYLSKTITHDKVKPINVLKTKKSVCSGYANLFDVMVEHIKVPTEVVSGFAKGYGYKPGDIMVNTNHAWNSVQLDGKQYLVDCTWGSGYISKEDKFVRNYREYYFLVDPDFLIWTHLPEKSEFQMIERKITKDEFDILPYVRRPFFENKINFIGNHRVGYIVESELSLDFKIDDNIKLLCTLKDEEEENDYEGVTYLTKKDGVTNIKLRPPSSGNFFLRISSKDGENADSYSGSIEYLITVPENFKKNSGYIKVWNDEIEKYSINFPDIHSYNYNLSNMLTLDYLCPKDVVFSANIKDSKNKKINNYTFIQRSKDGIQLLVNVPDEKKYTLTVYAKNMNDEGNYSGLAEYNLIGDVGDKRKVRTFPMQYGEFNKNNGKLSSPLKGTLKLNQNYRFLLEMDNVSEMSIIHNNKWIRFEKNNLNQFILDKVFDTVGKVKITAKINNRDNFSSILVYEIM